jgi:hypothetical protein
MADTTIYLNGPQGPVPIKAVDQGDGTYSLKVLGSGAAAIPFTIPFVAGYATITWTSMPAALTEFNAAARGRIKVDLTNATQARLIVHMMSTAGSANAELRAQYSTDDSSFSYMDGATGPSVAINAANVTLVSSWVNLAAGAKADVFLRVVGINGDGATSPTFGNISIQVR